MAYNMMFTVMFHHFHADDICNVGAHCIVTSPCKYQYTKDEENLNSGRIFNLSYLDQYLTRPLDCK
jgi:hypothetical protein